MKSKTTLTPLQKIERLYRQQTPAEVFIEQTKFKEKIVPPPSSQWPQSWIDITFKAYPRMRRVALPAPAKKISSSLLDVFNQRRSTRKYSGRTIDLVDLSSLLAYSVGIKQRTMVKDWNLTQRYYASGGARYPNEVYVIALNVEGLEPGIYHYNFKLHDLEQLRLGSIQAELSQCIGDQWLPEVGAVLAMSCVFGRTEVKYHSRGLRHAYIEAGHMGQNIYLWSTALGLGCCGLGGFVDDKMNALLRIDGYHEFVINALAIGHPSV